MNPSVTTCRVFTTKSFHPRSEIKYNTEIRLAEYECVRIVTTRQYVGWNGGEKVSFVIFRNKTKRRLKNENFIIWNDRYRLIGSVSICEHPICCWWLTNRSKSVIVKKISIQRLLFRWDYLVEWWICGHNVAHHNEKARQWNVTIWGWTLALSHL